MAINNTINNGILTLITKGSALGTSYNSVYIGLLTQLPSDAAHMDSADKDWEEVDFELNGEATGYGRYRLAYVSSYSTGAHGNRVIQTAPHWDADDEACIVVNDGDDMMFPNIAETLDASKFWTVEGFGLFSAENSSIATDVMLAYGKLVDAQGQDKAVTLRAGSVPIFYKDSFKLMLKDGDTAVAGGGN